MNGLQCKQRWIAGVYCRSKRWTRWIFASTTCKLQWRSEVVANGSCSWFANGIKTKQRIALQMDGEMQVSTADRSVGHDDYDNGRRANSNGDGRTMLLMVKINYMWVSFTRKVNRKQKHWWHCKTKVKSKCLCLLEIEVLDTMIDDEGENQLRLGVIYEQIG